MTTILHAELEQSASRSAALGLAILMAAELGHAQASEDSLLQPYYNFVHWASMRRPDRALEQFADDAIVIAGPRCTESAPCVGRAAIQRGYLVALFAGRITLPVRDQRFDAGVLTTHGETLFEDDPPRGTVRLRGGYAFEFHDGMISSLHVQFDRTDPTTANFLERREAALFPASAGNGMAVPDR